MICPSPCPPAEKVTLRLANPSDIPALYELNQSAMLHYAQKVGIPPLLLPALQEKEAELAAAISESYYFLAEEAKSKALLGAVRLTLKPWLEFTPEEQLTLPHVSGDHIVGYFTRFAVAEASQQRGVGSQLYESLLNQAYSLNLSWLFLHTAISNKSLVNFYQRRGFNLLLQSQKSGYDRGFFAKVLSPIRH